jgi:hypothetical protein
MIAILPDDSGEWAFLSLNHDVSPDGRRFLMAKSVGGQSESASTDFVAVLNWAEELKRLAKPQ